MAWALTLCDYRMKAIVRDVGKLLHRNNKKSRFLLFETVHILNTIISRVKTLKMHQNHWRLGNSPRPHCGSIQVTALPYLLAGLRDLLLRKGGKDRGNGREEDYYYYY